MQSNIYPVTHFTELQNLSEHVVASLSERNFAIVLLDGTLGSGKTTFTKEVGYLFGITEDIQSPTYALLREYTIPAPASLFVHMDLYRVSSFEEIESYGILDLFSHKQGIFFIEWPEKLRDWLIHLFPQDIISISFALSKDGTERTATIT